MGGAGEGRGQWMGCWGRGEGGGLSSGVYRSELSLELKQSSDSAVTAAVLRQSVPVWNGPREEEHLSYCPQKSSKVDVER